MHVFNTGSVKRPERLCMTCNILGKVSCPNRVDYHIYCIKMPTHSSGNLLLNTVLFCMLYCAVLCLWSHLSG